MCMACEHEQLNAILSIFLWKVFHKLIKFVIISPFLFSFFPVFFSRTCFCVYSASQRQCKRPFCSLVFDHFRRLRRRNIMKRIFDLHYGSIVYVFCAFLHLAVTVIASTTSCFFVFSIFFGIFLLRNKFDTRSSFALQLRAFFFAWWISGESQTEICADVKFD